ncbi:hypothetical protein llap_2613 [Limosa lapponica baueri]|uniref:Uncharacterized protein n=1 Tax=Limosa lapponica baueri TaxID=1758121 RepID=A0A2I0ULZ0_LIMLA|nr:hypothetical protein llap_2613 [Limosa lapponica baueri]
MSLAEAHDRDDFHHHKPILASFGLAPAEHLSQHKVNQFSVCAQEEYGIMEIHMDQIISVEHSTVGEAEDRRKKHPSCLKLESLFEFSAVTVPLGILNIIVNDSHSSSACISDNLFLGALKIVGFCSGTEPPRGS